MRNGFVLGGGEGERKQMESGLHLTTRDRTQHERKEYESAAIMTHAIHGDVIVPDVVLYPLRRISYLSLVPKILEANRTGWMQAMAPREERRGGKAFTGGGRRKGLGSRPSGWNRVLVHPSIPSITRDRTQHERNWVRVRPLRDRLDVT